MFFRNVLIATGTLALTLTCSILPNQAAESKAPESDELSAGRSPQTLVAEIIEEYCEYEEYYDPGTDEYYAEEVCEEYVVEDDDDDYVEEYCESEEYYDPETGEYYEEEICIEM
ncbi:MAG: hypothetical protein HC799_05920 [Limnothrix sp. RL_2_0]|nr:hypothetical protein [Limnothrix sp. RL_2_0]